ncbi:TonB-dependent receptor [Alteromonas halophila]|uniref:TonB-dependent receptor n=1 Tax=Alteromonas halophila TaxID=516698 RepID=A0A918MZ77_9ALTE|nr:TonB-dependent receptor [Alteromonas halophila]GGW91066.1 TonB-dependent receptor [Alteromonas halophila]
MKQCQTKRFALTPLAVAMGAALCSQLALAQQNDDDAPDAGVVERIEVTSSRRVSTVEETPYNLSVINGSELSERNIVDTVEMIRSVAGVTAVDRGYRNSGVLNNIIIRGMNVDSSGNGDFALNAAPTVSSYVNDTPLFANFILKDIDAVEVLRGPQGTLYGSGALAGTVRYRMKRPELEYFNGSVKGAISQTDGSEGINQNYDALINVPVSDSVAFRANVGVIRNDGVVDYTNVYALNGEGDPVAEGGDVAEGDPVFRSVEDADTVDIDYGRASLLFEPSDTFSALVSYQWQSDDIGGRRQVTTGTNWVSGTEQAYDEYENGAIQLEPSERKVDLMALELEWNLGFATLSSSTSDYEHTGSSVSDNTGFYAQNNWFGWFYGGTPRPMASALRSYEDEGFSQEIRLVSEPGETFDWIVGAFYLDQQTRATQDSVMPGFSEWAQASGFDETLASWGGTLTDQDFLYRDNGEVKDLSVFGELTWHINTDLDLTVGLRRFDNEISNDTLIELPIYPGASEVTASTEESDTLFKANLSYDVSDEMMLYATVSEGYRRGGTSAVPLTGGFAENPEYLSYDSDSVTNYELGVKGNTGEVFYAVTLYRMDWDDPQLNVTTPNWGFYAAVNGESARTQGVEIETRGYITDNLEYGLQYAYTDAELTDDLYIPAGTQDSPSEVLRAVDGERLPSTSEHTFSANLQHYMEMEGEYYLLSRASAYYQSDSRNSLGDNPVFDIMLPSFWIANLSTTLHATDWSATVYVKNVFNEEGVTGVLSEGYMGTDPEENFYGNASKSYITQPRTIGIAFQYQF